MSAGYPAQQGSYATTNVSTGSPFTVNLPASIVAGETLICWILRRSSAGTGVQTFTFPSGWSRVAGPIVGPNTNGRFTGEVWVKTADGSEGSTMSVTSSLTTTQRCIAIVGRFDSLYATPEYSVSTEAQANSGNWDASICTFTTPNWKHLVFAVCFFESTANAVGYPSGYTLYQQLLEGVAANVTGTRIIIAAKEVEGSSEDPGAGSSSSTSWDAIALAIKGLVSQQFRSAMYMQQ